MKLPLNCEAEYYRDFLSEETANLLFRKLSETYSITIAKFDGLDNPHFSVDFGKYMFLDKDLYEAGKFPEPIWGQTAVWPGFLLPVKEKIERHTGHVFNVCVLICYPDGHSGVGFHSDYTAFGDTSMIPSLSLGEERVFCLREKSTMEIYSVVLENGSLIIMGEHCQERYEHALPKDPKYQNPRINLTFRKYGFS